MITRLNFAKKAEKPKLVRTTNYKPHTKADLNNRDLYEFYVKRYKENIGTIQYITYKDFAEIINEYCLQLMYKVINGHKVNLGSYLSTLFIKEVKRKIKIDKFGEVKLAIDWTSSCRKYGTHNRKEFQKIYIENQNNGIEMDLCYYTSPYLYRIYWNVGFCRIHHKSGYEFRPSWQFKKQLSHKINSNDQIKLTYRENTIVDEFEEYYNIPIHMYTMNDELMRSFANVKMAVEAVDIIYFKDEKKYSNLMTKHTKSILNVCLMNTDSYKGYKWSF